MLRERTGQPNEPNRYCSTPTNRFVLALPEPSLELSQDEEWCLVRLEDGWQELRFHDYAEIFDVPELYEYIFYDVLKCQSPTVIRRLLANQLRREGRGPGSLRVLDLGAGNGMVGEALDEIGVRTVVGADITEAAARATERDRPGLYTDYIVADMTSLEPESHERLRRHRLNCLTCVAALGFGDIPSRAFIEAFNLIDAGGLVAFNIKEDFLDKGSGSDFADLIHSMIERGALEVRGRERYIHRISTGGTPLHYVAFCGTKHCDVPIAS